jgi:YceI-like domain/Prokaryotic cytochrome b561
VDFRVAAKSVDANSASLNDYLRSKVFFNVARFPDMRFVSTSVEKRDEHHARVTGDLTMLGVTRPISLDVEVARKLAWTNQRVGLKATGVINRRDFGMNSGYPLISDAIHLTVTTEASAELRNTRESWGFMAKILHWSAAVLVFAMLGLGLTTVHGDLGAGAKFEAYQLHKSAGFLVLAVTLLRGLWCIANPPPAPPAGTRPWERRLALLCTAAFTSSSRRWSHRAGSRSRRRRYRFQRTFLVASSCPI